MIYKKQFEIGLKDIGKNNEITNTALLERLENIAAYHSDSAGYGVNTVEQTKVTWVLLEWKLQVIKRPKYGQKINIDTWSRYTNKCYSYRDFEVYDENKQLCAIATSKWLLINVEKNKIAKVEESLIAWNILYNTEDSEECVNDTWLITWNKIPPKTPTKLSAFLGKITRNLALDNFRKNSQKVGKEV